MSNLITISGVRGYIDQNGTAQLNLEDVARGLGFVDNSKGTEYVRWNNVGFYLNSFGFSQEVAKDTFIPENIFYRLAMKAKNETAEIFQAKVADEILPTIRRHGMYATDQLLDNPDFAIEVFRKLKTEREHRKALELENAKKSQIINELQPKATYYDLVLQNKTLLPITKIAKDYGLSGQALNGLLHELGVQYKMGDTWLLYTKYADKGYTQSKTHVIDADKSKINTYWTQAGRLFIYSLLKQRDILPLIEKEFKKES